MAVYGRYRRPLIWNPLYQLQRTIPIDVEALAEYHGITICRRRLPDSLGAILHQSGGKWYLYLNVTHCIERQRFTVAHELAHVLDYRLFDGIPRRGQSAEERERDTDHTAAQILMPAMAVQLWLTRNPSVSELARRFVVSQDAMLRRVQEVRGQISRSGEGSAWQRDI